MNLGGPGQAPTSECPASPRWGSDEKRPRVDAAAPSWSPRTEGLLASARLGQPVPDEPSFEPRVLDQFAGPTRELLVQAVLYKTLFLAPGFRALAELQPADVRDTLVRMSEETAAEIPALIMLVQQWEVEEVDAGDFHRVSGEMRKRLLQDLALVKEGLVETGIAMAMCQHSAQKRERFLKIVDIDRQHADHLRQLMGKPVTSEFARAVAEAAPTSGAYVSRDPARSLSGSIQRRVEEMQQRGFVPSRVVMGPDGARHLRDEGAITENGLVFGLHLDIDMAWKGEVFAIESEERMGYSEILSAAKDDLR